MRFRLYGILLVTSLFLAGCAPSLTGKWKMNTTGSAAAVAASTIDFARDGTLTQSVTTPLGEAKVNGVYTTNGDNFDITVKNVELSAQMAAVVPPALKTKLDEQFKNQKQTGTFKVEGDKLTMTRDGKSTTFDRVKE